MVGRDCSIALDYVKVALNYLLINSKLCEDVNNLETLVVSLYTFILQESIYNTFVLTYCVCRMPITQTKK